MLQGIIDFHKTNQYNKSYLYQGFIKCEIFGATCLAVSIVALGLFYSSNLLHYVASKSFTVAKLSFTLSLLSLTFFFMSKLLDSISDDVKGKLQNT